MRPSLHTVKFMACALLSANISSGYLTQWKLRSLGAKQSFEVIGKGVKSSSIKQANQLCSLSNRAASSSSFDMDSSIDGKPSPQGNFKPSSSRRDLHQQNDEEKRLVPEKNPNVNPNAKSLSGVSLSFVSAGIDALYPPTELAIRNAKSRTDGYWKYLERGEQPPQQYTYGEFDLEFFAELLDVAWGRIQKWNEECISRDREICKNQKKSAWENKVFCDIGSGTGRLVIAAAALHPHWKLCRGLEILQSIHEVSVEIASRCEVLKENINPDKYQSTSNDPCEIRERSPSHALCIPCQRNDESTAVDRNDTLSASIPLAPLNFTCGSFADPYEYLGDIDCAFVFSSCMGSDLIEELSRAIGRQCKPGTIIITTEFPLFLRGKIDPVDGDDTIPSGEYEIQLLEKIDGWCWVMGGKSAAYIHQVRTSLSKSYRGRRSKQQVPLEEEAFRLVQLMEKGEFVDTKRFLKEVYNDMIFNGLPQEFLPNVDQ
mmetsp:Transcript_10601/g.21026  ORF Transcript_10601/g.21026 Transcript_10601/m.21026 type:complete len:486 (-) Transcript_10601:999-2456(-)